MSLSFDSIISFIGVATFGLLIVPTIVRWRLKERAIATLFLYLGLGLVWNIGMAVKPLEILPDSTSDPFFSFLTDASRGAMPMIFGALTLTFLTRRILLYWYSGFSGLMFILWLAIRLNLGQIDHLILNALPASNDIQLILTALEIFMWLVATLITPWAIVTSLRQRRQAQFRNRMRYWVGGIAILSAATLIILLQNPAIAWLGSILNIVGALLITYIIMRSHLPDLQVIVSHLMRTIAVTVALSVLLFAAFYGAYLVNNKQISSQNAFFWFFIAAVTLAFILPRLARWMETVLTKLLLEAGFDESSTIKAYSQNVSTEWDFEKLGQQALSFVLQELNIERGALFINEGEGSGHVTLKLIACANIPEVNTGYFFADDPWIMYLRYAQTAVTQYDVDVLPEYKTMDENCKDWLAALDVEIFLPIILRRRELLGVLALGSKPNNRPYLDSDIERLNVLASQIALDIDKARMFNQLGSVNKKMGEMSKKFKTFDQGKADFLSIASHELRTPLTHIHGYASMLMEATEEDLQSPAYLQHIFTGIAKGSNRLKDVVDLIFDVSKADIGEMDLSLGPVNLANVVREAAEIQTQAIQQRQHQLIISGVDQLPTIQGDSKRLVQALDHLINNAVKYTPDGGTITITGCTTTEEGKLHVELITTDTGIGIDSNDQTRIFEKFYRVGRIENHSSGSVKFKGAGPGLGLPLVAGIARAHGGKVWVESPKYDEDACPGSQFHLILPVKQARENVVEAAPAVSPSMAKTRHWRSEDMKAVKKRAAQKQNNTN